MFTSRPTEVPEMPRLAWTTQDLEGKQFPFRLCASQMPQTISQRIQSGVCRPLTDAFSQRHQASDVIRDVRSVPSLHNSCRHCMDMKHVTKGSLLSHLMIQSMKRQIIFTGCLDTSFLQGQHPPSTTMVHIKMQLILEKKFEGTKMIFCFISDSSRRS